MIGTERIEVIIKQKCRLGKIFLQLDWFSKYVTKRILLFY